ncbi:hypothetical protein PAAG_06277 [Paracoccidioides lutzii Pb01]|uniref:Stc1 domain-containing protein n=1 Tax=Paracoccidioides lutzii (strain ATCC MYA-826 / Pb01) TaxID=502779 RepID=C1H5T2_PARBA|nr:hypothetical protein PAAG_06277 [Paracoccidioides lutzii Pb01]EEH35230.2 hypothetical protein PAAG_06277 [Paracoccidioides lutzii Pb01]
MAPRNRRFDYIVHNRCIASIKLPETTRFQSAFSKRQLDLLRRCILEKSSNATTNERLATCFNCATNQVVELTCCVCDTTMALEFFSKTQRHDPDSARCKNCVQGHLDREPVSEDLREAIENASSYAATIITHNQGGNRHALAPTSNPATTDNAIQEQKTFHPVNLTTAIQNTDDHGIDGGEMWIDARYKGKLAKHSKDRRVSEGSEEDKLSETSEERELTKEGNPVESFKNRELAEISKAREVSNSLKKHELAESSNEQDRQDGDFHIEHEFIAFDPRGKPHIRTAEAPASPPSVHSGWEMLGVRARSQMASKAAAERQKRGNPGFAKTSGTRYSKNEAPTMHRPRPTERTVESDDEYESDVDLQKYM